MRTLYVRSSSSNNNNSWMQASLSPAARHQFQVLGALPSIV